MSTTSSTHQGRHLPLLASISVACVIAAVGVVGVGWHESGTSGTAPALTPPTNSANALVAERDLTRNSQYLPNARVAEYEAEQSGQYDGSPQIGLRDHQHTTAGGKTVGLP